MTTADPNHLIETVEGLFLPELRPEKVAPVSFDLVSELGAPEPINRAYVGLARAINTVLESDYDAHVRDFDERRDRLLDWREHLTAHPIPDPEVSAAAIGRGEMTTSVALFGTDRWEEMYDDLSAMLLWAAQRSQETSRKFTVVVSVEKRAIDYVTRSSAQVQQLVKSATRKMNRLPDDATERRQQITAAAEDNIAAVNAVVLRRVRALIREVLDLDEGTAAIPTDEWLRRHGLD